MLDKGKEELIEKILEELDNYTNVNWNLKEYYEKAILNALTDFVIIKKTNINYCQSCGKDFVSGDLVYYAVIDNNIVCSKCSEAHFQKELRVVK